MLKPNETSEHVLPSPSHTPHSSSAKVELHVLSQPLSTASPFGVPAQSSQSSPLLSAATQPQSLVHAVPPHSPAQSSILPSQSQSPSAIPLPLHIPHSS